MNSKISVIAMVITTLMLISGCEPSGQRAEKDRLEKLYAMDSVEIAIAFSRGFSEPYNAVRNECEKERIDKVTGRWCGKWSEVKAAKKPIKNDFSRPSF